MTLDDQIACVRREIAMRKIAYPRWVNDGRMTLEKSLHEIETMHGVLQTLEKLGESLRSMSYLLDDA